MGSGAWSSRAYTDAVATTMAFADVSSADSLYDSITTASVNQVYKQHRMDDALNPYRVIRECCDSEEHPNTLPVILALDVTGSMGTSCKATAAQLNEIMTNLYGTNSDIQFMTMAIGDVVCDNAPIQATQFEADVRILDQLMKVYFEGGGGGNSFESYSAAWYFGLNNTSLDCWKRGRKGIIITMGDEPLNSYLPGRDLKRFLGCQSAEDVDTKELYNKVCEKFDVYHIAINDPNNSYRHYKNRIENSFGQILGDHLRTCTVKELPAVITQIVAECEKNNETITFATSSVMKNEDGEISW